MGWWLEVAARLSVAESLRLIFVIRPHEVGEIHTLVAAWREAFSDVFPSDGPNICVWVTGQDLAEVDLPGVCSHLLPLPSVLDGYATSPLRKISWTPWGQKSGPNVQFFQILRLVGSLHATEWVLQLESDTVPVRKVSEEDIPWVLNDSDNWVVGASTGHADHSSLSQATAKHLNGAAFYRVGDSGFMNFLETIWVQTLLYLLRYRPALAYDVLTSEALWSVLPVFLRESWRTNSHRFVVTSNMINLSNRKSVTRNPINQLAELSVPQGGTASPWFVHLAKPA